VFSNTHKEKQIRYTLGITLLILAINAFGGGYYGLVGAKSVPVEWLKGSPFQTYLIPSLVLFILIGGSALFAGVQVLMQGKMAPMAAVFCGAILVVWLCVQVAIIGYVSWMQPVTAVIAVVIFLLAWQLPGYDV
jgi:hypothetical protein